MSALQTSPAKKIKEKSFIMKSRPQSPKSPNESQKYIIHNEPNPLNKYPSKCFHFFVCQSEKKLIRSKSPFERNHHKNNDEIIARNNLQKQRCQSPLPINIYSSSNSSFSLKSNQDSNTLEVNVSNNKRGTTQKVTAIMDKRRQLFEKHNNNDTQIIKFPLIDGQQTVGNDKWRQLYEKHNNDNNDTQKIKFPLIDVQQQQDNDLLIKNIVNNPQQKKPTVKNINTINIIFPGNNGKNEAFNRKQYQIKSYKGFIEQHN